MRALVTGADGFAGSHLVEYLLAQGWEVAVLVRPESNLSNLHSVLQNLRIERADIRDLGILRKILSMTKPNRIYHLAAQSSPAESFKDPKTTYEVNFGGTLNLLLAWRAHEIDCRLLYVSSSEVYGLVLSEKRPLTEEAPLRPVSPYAGSKAAAELLAYQFFSAYGLPIIRVRPFNHTGPRQSSEFVCSSIARQFAEIELGLRPPRIQLGNLDASRDFSDVRDIVRGYYLLLENGKLGEVYHVCSGRPVTIRALANMLANAAPASVEIVTDSSRMRPLENWAAWGDASKARNEVGWRPQYALQATLQDLKVYWQGILHPQVAASK